MKVHPCITPIEVSCWQITEFITKSDAMAEMLEYPSGAFSNIVGYAAEDLRRVPKINVNTGENIRGILSTLVP